VVSGYPPIGCLVLVGLRIVDLKRIIIKESERYKIVLFVPNSSYLDKQRSKDGLFRKRNKNPLKSLYQAKISKTNYHYKFLV